MQPPAHPWSSDTDRVHRWSGFPATFWAAVAGCSILAMLLLAARLAVTRQRGHLSLVWDSLLAWIPVLTAVLIYRSARRSRPRRVILVALGAGWLLFFPNAPYLVTQMIHLNPLYGPSRRPIPNWLDAVLPAVPQHRSPEWFDFLLIATVVVAGLLLTFASLRLVQRAIAGLAGERFSCFAVGGFVCLGSFGVALGRHARLNSWDVFGQPLATASRIAAWVLEPRVSVSTLVLAALLGTCYIAMTTGVRPEPRRQDAEPRA